MIDDLYKQMDENKKMIEQTSGTAKCPKCKELQRRVQDKCNLLKCNRCDVEFCFQCGRLIPDGKEHFENTNCYYIDPN
jgi:hypothetical protein